MAEVSPDQSSKDVGAQESKQGNIFIEIKSVPARSYARDLRLREGDVIAAIDGVPCHLDIAEFEEVLLDTRDEDSTVFVTIARDHIFFEIFISGPLGVTFDYTDVQHSPDISQGLVNHPIGVKSQYQTYEALRDVRRHVTLYSTNYSGLATICPPLWLLQHRAIEPLAAVIAAYATAAAVHWFAFVLVVFLIGLYFHRIQFRIIRNYNIFTDHFYWLVCAAKTTADAQRICREIDPKCIFSFSYIGPPEDTALEDKKTSRRASRKST